MIVRQRPLHQYYGVQHARILNELGDQVNGQRHVLDRYITGR